MSSKPLPPSRPPGSFDLLDAGGDATPRTGDSDTDWRADALGRSRHSRLASEVREPLDDSDPVRAEQLCAEVTRNALGDFAPALVLLSKKRRRRVQTLAAWTVALFDFASRPGFAGLDGDRLAQINAWEFRTEEALEGYRPSQPVFVSMAREEALAPWPREALDEIASSARQLALAATRGKRGPADTMSLDCAIALGRALFEAAFGAECGDGDGDGNGGGDSCSPGAIAPLAGIAILQARLTPGLLAPKEWILSIETVRSTAVPPGWRRAVSYLRRALESRLRAASSKARLGVATRLRLLALSALRPH